MNKSGKKGLALGAAIGAVAGVVTGVLFAPKSGKETRQDIKDGAKKVADRFEKEGKHLHEELTSLIEKADTKFKETGKTVSDKSHEVLDHAKHARDQLTTLAKSVKAGKAEDKDLDKALAKAKEATAALKTYLKK